MSTYTCPVCEERFDGSDAVRTHAWDHHSACHYCGEQYDSEELLYNHWLTTHPDELSRIDYKRAESAVESLTFAERLSRYGVGAAVGGVRRRTLLLASGAIVGGGAAIGSVFNGDESSDDTGNGSPTPGQKQSQRPLPPSPTNHRYPVMGTGEADATITYFGSWKCPYCAQFSTGFLSTIMSEYVVPGKITLEYRNVAYSNGTPFLGADAPAAGRAGLTVWNEFPASYWAYHETIMANQPSERKQWATADRLVSFAEQAGVPDPSAIRRAIQESKYEDTLKATSKTMTENGIAGTPKLLIDGTVASPFKKERVRRLIDNATA